MKLNYCQLPLGNFGDDLNVLIWSEIFGPVENFCDDIELWGIGTLLGKMGENRIKKLVLGTGGGTGTPKLSSTNWDVRWVRGPLTACKLGLPPATGLGDGSILWSGLEKYRGPRKDGPVGIIPHWKTTLEFDWEQLCLDADLLLINASQSPNQVTEQLHQCSRGLVESLHGAIFADTLGIPWAPIVLSKGFNTFKWNDWLATIGRVFTPFVMDRSLVGSLSLFQALKNRLSHTLGISYKSFNLSLRPVETASAEDVRHVVTQLREFSQNHSEFACSSEARVQRQRQSMLQECQRTADKYGLPFLKGGLLPMSQTQT